MSIVESAATVILSSEDGAKKGKLYLNGGLISLNIDTAGTGVPSDDSGRDLLIGIQSSGNAAFDGPIGEVQIYKKALSANEVKSLYSITRGRYSI